MRSHTTALTLLFVFGFGLTASAAEVELGEILKTGKKLYSQGNEELIIRDFFKDRREGVFVDVGAWKWRHASTTYYLEKHLGWTGIAIDAQPDLEADYIKNRPGTRFFQYIVTDHSGGKETLFIRGPISSTEQEHHKSFEAARNRPAREVVVETITLNDLLDRAGVEKIDFLSMDIERGEPPALAGFDIERFRPELVCVEAAIPEIHAALTSYFEAHDYERIDSYHPYDWINWYYRPKAPKAKTE
jgi:FkbM family methyltransferase